MFGKILIVDDDEGALKLISKALKTNGYMFDTATDGQQALTLATSADNYSLIISDIVMPEMDGLEFVESLKKVSPNTPIILATAFSDIDFAIRALNLGALAFFVKPFNMQELIEKVNHVKVMEREERGKALVLNHLSSESHEVEMETGTLMKGDNLYSIGLYFAKKFAKNSRQSKVDFMKATLAIHEALKNAVEHGNLGLSSDMKPDLLIGEDDNSYQQMIDERLANPEFAGKKVFWKFIQSPEKVYITIRDEGEGFNWANLTREPFDNQLSHGRGLIMIKAGMDEVSFNEKGNEITLARFTTRD